MTEEKWGRRKEGEGRKGRNDRRERKWKRGEERKERVRKGEGECVITNERGKE